MESSVYLIGSEGYIGSLLRTLLPVDSLVRVANARRRYDDSNVLTSLPGRVPPTSTCILLAALAGEKACEENRKLAYETNVELVKRVCELGYNKIIFTSTTSLYAVTDSYANEESEVRATSYYTETKLKAEEIILLANSNNVVARLAIVMGVSPNTNWTQLVNSMVKSAIEGVPIKIYAPDSFRPYYDVYDVSRGLLLLLKSSEFDGQIVNVGSTALNYTKLNLVEKLKELIPGLTYSISADTDKRNYKVSFMKFEEKYQHTMTLKDTLVSLMNYHRASLSH